MDIRKNFITYKDVPIFETEYGDWVGYGTWDKRDFLNKIADICYSLTGENIIQDSNERDLLYPYVHHLKARVEENPDFYLHWKKEDQEDPNAIDITLLIL